MNSSDADLVSVLTGIDTWLQNTGNLLPAFGGVLGIALGIFALCRLYDYKMSDGFQHRAKPGGYVVGFIWASLMTIFVVILAWIGGLYSG